MNLSSQHREKILILAAIPQGLRLDKEIREIEEAIRRSVRRDSYEIRIRTAIRTQDIRRAIQEERPQIVHFCGHGMEDGSLVLEDDGGNHKLVLPTGLAALFKLHTDYVKCVLLNACYSSKSAEVIGKHINYVIGMNQPIEDRAAIVFAQGFYDGLGFDNINNRDVIQRAFNEGIVAIQLENLLLGTIPSIWKLGIAQREIESINRNDDGSSNHNEQEAQRLQRQKEQLEYENNLCSDLLILCPHCKFKNPNAYNFCQNCGTSLSDLDNQRRQAELKKQEQRKSSPPVSNSGDDLSSDSNVDYTKLRNFLKAGQWEKADYETYVVMLQVVGRTEGDWIRSEELLNFPFTDLRTIDLLWVKHSNGHFGFSVQKKIYLEVGGKPDGKFYKEAWNTFVDRVGWRQGSVKNKDWISYSPVTFHTKASPGHLPHLSYEGGLGRRFVGRFVERFCRSLSLGFLIDRTMFSCFSSLASRLETCNLFDA